MLLMKTLEEWKWIKIHPCSLIYLITYSLEYKYICSKFSTFFKRSEYATGPSFYYWCFLADSVRGESTWIHTHAPLFSVYFARSEFDISTCIIMLTFCTPFVYVCVIRVWTFVCVQHANPSDLWHTVKSIVNMCRGSVVTRESINSSSIRLNLFILSYAVQYVVMNPVLLIFRLFASASYSPTLWYGIQSWL
jgi:hypothetical protein